jgi:hypothetical protein
MIIGYIILGLVLAITIVPWFIIPWLLEKNAPLTLIMLGLIGAGIGLFSLNDKKDFKVIVNPQEVVISKGELKSPKVYSFSEETEFRLDEPLNLVATTNDEEVSFTLLDLQKKVKVRDVSHEHRLIQDIRNSKKFYLKQGDHILIYEFSSVINLQYDYVIALLELIRRYHGLKSTMEPEHQILMQIRDERIEHENVELHESEENVGYSSKEDEITTSLEANIVFSSIDGNTANYLSGAGKIGISSAKDLIIETDTIEDYIPNNQYTFIIENKGNWVHLSRKGGGNRLNGSMFYLKIRSNDGEYSIAPRKQNKQLLRFLSEIKSNPEIMNIRMTYWGGFSFIGLGILSAIIFGYLLGEFGFILGLIIGLFGGLTALESFTIGKVREQSRKFGFQLSSTILKKTRG